MTYLKQKMKQIYYVAVIALLLTQIKNTMNKFEIKAM